MNREILFRGKCAYYDGEWAYGVPLQHYDGSWQIISGKGGASILTTVIPETIGQFTGLTDKNGVKIFKGDIIKGKGKNVFVVEYNQNIASFITKGFGTLSCPCMNIGTMNYYGVVGNIHDNPELMGG